MKKQSDITVVIIVYNGGKTVLKSIHSLIKQTFQNWCCIVINDGSKDNTAEILNSISDTRFQIIHLPINKGRGYARNVALKSVKTKYLCMLDADDLYFPNKLEFQYCYMEENPSITLMSTSMAQINKKGEFVKIIESNNIRRKLKYNDYLKFIMLPHASSIIRMSDLDVNYNVALKYCEDNDFLRRLLINKSYIFINRITYLYNREDSFSIKKHLLSLVYYLKSISSLPIRRKYRYYVYTKSIFKEIIIIAVSMINKNYYLNNIGRKPNIFEISEVNKIISDLN